MLIDVVGFDGNEMTIDLSKVLYLQTFEHEKIRKVAANPDFNNSESMVIAQNVQANPDLLKGRTTIVFTGGTSLIVREDRKDLRQRWLEMMTAGTDLLTATLKGTK